MTGRQYGPWFAVSSRTPQFSAIPGRICAGSAMKKERRTPNHTDVTPRMRRKQEWNRLRDSPAAKRECRGIRMEDITCLRNVTSRSARGWFYHPSEDGQLRSVAELTGIYLRSVGCGGYLNLGLAPMPDGLLADGDILRLREWKKAVDALFAHPVVQCEMPLRDGAGIIEFGRPARFNLLEMAEQIADGEKIRGYEVLLRTAGGGFRSLISGKAIGRRRLKRLPETVEGDAIQIRLTDAAAPGRGTPCRLLCGGFSGSGKGVPGILLPDYLRTAHHPEGTEWHCDLGCEMPVKGFRFTPDPGLPAGTPDRYELLLSSDGRTWRSVAAGEFSNIRANPLPCTVTFRQTEHARF